MGGTATGAAGDDAGATGVALPEAQRRRAVAGWYLFDWAAQPFFTLVVTFLFGPYFASTLAADAVDGQALWGYAGAAAGLVVGIAAPVLGAFADHARRRKGWILGFSVLLVGGSLFLGFALPDAENAVAIALAGYMIGTIGGELATVFTNAMIPDLARPGRVGHLSGNGAAFGYVGGLVSLFATLALLDADPETGLTRLGVEPLFGLVSAEASNAAVGPFCAVWYIVFVWPLFAFVPERAALEPGRAEEDGALRAGLADLRRTVAFVRRTPVLWRFLLASMIYRDGLTALAVFGGIYAAGQLGWTQTELGLLGIAIVLAAVVGSWIGGVADDRFGSAIVMRWFLVGLIATTVFVTSIGSDHILFVVPVAETGEGFLTSGADIAMLVAGVLIGLFFGPVHANSRTMLVRLSPSDQMTALFGLFALAGKVTSFLGPLFVAIATDAFDSQRAGAAVIPFFFLVGMLLLPNDPRSTRRGRNPSASSPAGDKSFNEL